MTLFDGCDSEFWIYQVAMQGNTFRAAYKLSKNLTASASLMYRKLGTTLTGQRRQASDVLRHIFQ